jgi:putative DNA primase/helicase
MPPDLRLVENMDDEPHYGDEPPAPDLDDRFFTALGHDRGRYYVSTNLGGQVLDLSAKDLVSHGALMQLAPLLFWEMNYPTKTEAFNARAAGNSIMQACFRAGIYDPNRIRGRGAWLDGGRTVLHLGDRLIVDGVEMQIRNLNSEFIYERGRRMDVQLEQPLTTAQSSELIDLCMQAPWEDRDGMGRLLAGWLVIAPVCGAMPWRPHIYLTSEAGGGKSWIIDHLIRPFLCSLEVRAQSKTTEAGLRGELGIDARPVIFDEFESQNDQDRARIQLVLDLARQASSEDGADILKGTQAGGVRRYRIRSCFLYSSINLGLGQAADESRTIVLTLRPPTDHDERIEQFGKLKEFHERLVTLAFPGALLARTLSLLPTIRQNCEVFAQAIARAGHSRRTGDTIGVLMAGAYSLRSTKVATAAQADEFVAGKEWLREAVSRSDAEPEWQRALSFLVQQRLRYIGNNSRPEEIPIGDLIIGVVSPGSNDGYGVSPMDARRALTRAGIKITDEGDAVLIAHASDTLSRLFERTPWSTGWLATLKRTPGCVAQKKTVRFGSLTAKAISIPMEALLREEGSA